MPDTNHEQDETLGPCGCVDYHMADCPTRSNSITPVEALGPDYERCYDED